MTGPEYNPFPPGTIDWANWEEGFSFEHSCYLHYDSFNITFKQEEKEHHLEIRMEASFGDLLTVDRTLPIMHMELAREGVDVKLEARKRTFLNLWLSCLLLEKLGLEGYRAQVGEQPFRRGVLSMYSNEFLNWWPVELEHI